MAVSSCDKEVATRLFRMLAVNEQTANTVKRDHASYAKLSLLTQQAQLLQRQAVQVVNKSAARATEERKIGLCENSTALSCEFDDGAKRLLGVLAVNAETVLAIKRDPAASAKLSLLAGQADLLRAQATECIGEAELNRHLAEIHAEASPGCRPVVGTVYYHYTQNGKEVLSRIAADQWSSYEVFHGSYLYDFDFTFRKLNGEPGDEDEDEDEGMALHPCAAATAPLALGLSEDSSEEDAAMEEEPTGTRAAAEKTFTPICGVLSRW
jgi:hypothetical protein